MERSDVFRKVSLERLASPEQLDQLFRVVPPRSWIALSGFGLIIIALISWGFTGAVPTKVSGSGVLIRTGGVSMIAAPGSGRVVDIAVRPGEVVEAGQVVARIRQPELEERLQVAEARLIELKTKRDQEESFDKNDIQLRLDHFRQRRETVQRVVDADRERVVWLQKKITARRDLLDDGLITRQQLINTREQLQAVEQGIERQRAELQQIEIEQQSLMSQNERSETSRSFEINAQQRIVTQIQEELRRKGRVISTDKGRAIEIRTEPGALVRKGESVLSFSRIGRSVKNLEAVVYVSAQDGKKVRPGMTIQLAPSIVEPEEYGRMVGVVTYVSDYPATTEGMMHLLGNQQLVQTMSSQGAPYEVHADILPSSDTQSGYEWTSSGGPPLEIQSGTLCQSLVTTEERRPIELMLPTLKYVLGV